MTQTNTNEWTQAELDQADAEFEKLLKKVTLKSPQDFSALTRIFGFSEYNANNTFKAISVAKEALAESWGISRRAVDKHVAKGGFKILVFLWASYTYAVNLNRVNPVLTAWRRNFTRNHDAPMLKEAYSTCLDIFEEAGHDEAENGKRTTPQPSKG